MLKKLIYKSHYRGTKEGDFLLSSFAKTMLAKCSDNEVKIYEMLLEYTDSEIHNWIAHKENAPTHLRPIISKIAEFHNL